MRQEDYLLREIEKIGSIFKAILNKLGLGKVDTSISIENHFEEAKGMILNGTGFDLDAFISLDETQIEAYISNYQGIKRGNLELLADILTIMGMSDEEFENSKEYLKKALFLYKLCISADKTFSLERESKISLIKESLNS